MNMRTQIQTLRIAPTDERLLSPAQLALRWGLSIETLKRRRREGKLNTIKIGRSVRFRLSEVLALEAGLLPSRVN